MNIKDWINPLNKVADIASEYITDKDKLNEFSFKLKELGVETHLAELRTKTVPLVDALHKMGRQIQGYLAMLFGFILVLKGHDITMYEAILIGGPTSLYTLMKGKGK